jgi:hypothetical protein
MRTQEIVERLVRAKEAANMENASFNSEEETIQIKEKTRLFRQIWIIGPIDRALFLLGYECGKRNVKKRITGDPVFWDGYKAAKDGRGAGLAW